MTREELQILPISLIKKYNRIALQWCTNLGKSKAAIDIANFLIKKEYSENEKPLSILLIVAETAHKSNWKKEFQKWKLKTSSVTIECYASLKKYKDTYWDLVIFDEAHHLNSDLRLNILKTLYIQNILLLSATLPSQTLQSLTEIFGEFKVSKITLREAIKWGILPTPKIYLIPLLLDNTISHCTITESWGRGKKKIIGCNFHERWKYLNNKTKYPNITLKISCTQQQKYDYLSSQFEYWKNRFFQTRQEYIKNKWLQVGSKRKIFLGELKTKIASTLLKKLKDNNKRFICFCTNIEQAEWLGGKNAIHSKKNNSLDIIQDFNNKKINNLFAVGMLQEGQNLKDIEAGVIIQLSGQERAFIQEFGRSMRAINPTQFIFYYKNTRDEEYLKNVFTGIHEEYITTINNIEEIEL